ncbi:hypothetical protein B5V89_09795 [Heyndrickxia sporothermodurans]|uniref:DUF86 domain-containing protein n=1 Tax=Heyndrickxia TaxID=2837504 RepID=UPI000D39A838|nr:DUF86 domain-containing protein [Heyndrickxia sporothermodurans]PTY78563.1 hypothetical protein B5V89_09795 [Heyndrickxia sporothermodurans]
MYFVDREKIETTLHYMENRLQLLNTTEKWETELEKCALERIAHTIIESILDVGNSMIDGFIMRDPGSYEDIIDILLDEKVINEEMAKGLMEIIMYRKILVQQYTSIDHEEMCKIFVKNKEPLSKFAPSVRSYLENELGPVSAFKN